MDLTIHGGVVTGSEILITDSAGQLFAEPKQFDAISGDIWKYYAISINIIELFGRVGSAMWRTRYVMLQYYNIKLL